MVPYAQDEGRFGSCRGAPASEGPGAQKSQIPSMSWGAVGGRKCNFPTKLAPPILSQRSSLCSVCGMPLGDMSSKKAQYGCGDGFANELIGRTFKCCVISVGHLGLGFGWCGEASNLAGMC